MKKNKHVLILISTVFLLSLTGCGTKMVEMTDEEQDIIVRYVAHVIGEYNIYQKDGMTGALPEEEPQKPSESESETESESGGGTLKPGGSSGGDVASSGEIALAELFGNTDGLTVKYNKLKVVEAYVYAGSYSLDAGKNDRYAVLSFTITNTGQTDLEIDNFSRKMAFSVGLADGSTYTMENTMILPNDLATYKNKLKAGGSEELVLLFKIPKEKENQTGQFGLYVTENKVKKSIKL